MPGIVPEFTRGPWRYTLCERRGAYALYAYVPKAHPAVVHYEVVHIRARKAAMTPRGIFVPAHEGYPTSNEWGKHGWTFLTREEAQAFFALRAQVQPDA